MAVGAASEAETPQLELKVSSPRNLASTCQTIEGNEVSVANYHGVNIGTSWSTAFVASKWFQALQRSLNLPRRRQSLFDLLSDTCRNGTPEPSK